MLYVIIALFVVYAYSGLRIMGHWSLIIGRWG